MPATSVSVVWPGTVYGCVYFGSFTVRDQSTSRPWTQVEESWALAVPIIKMTANEFGVADYIVFACMLLISSAIGVYHAYGGKQSSTKEYLMAGKGMGCFPIFVSLLASYLSAVTLLGVPSEIYTYGVQYCVLILSYFFLCTTAAVIYAPIFCRLNLTSAHEVNNSTSSLFLLPLMNYLTVSAFKRFLDH